MAVGLAALMSVAPLTSRADEFPGLAIGQTVRLTKASGQPSDVPSQTEAAFQNLPGRFTAEVVSMDEDSLSLSIDDDGETVLVPRRLIERLEVSRGRSHQRGAAHGLAIGLAIGTIVGLTGDGTDQRDLVGVVRLFTGPL